MELFGIVLNCLELLRSYKWVDWIGWTGLDGWILLRIRGTSRSYKQARQAARKVHPKYAGVRDAEEEFHHYADVLSTLQPPAPATVHPSYSLRLRRRTLRTSGRHLLLKERIGHSMPLLLPEPPAPLLSSPQPSTSDTTTARQLPVVLLCASNRC